MHDMCGQVEALLLLYFTVAVSNCSVDKTVNPSPDDFFLPQRSSAQKSIVELGKKVHFAGGR